jgi:beta-glucosidase
MSLSLPQGSDENNDNPRQEQRRSSSTLLDNVVTGYTWKEKLKWLNGYDLWSLYSIPGLSASGDDKETSIRLSDGPHGVRKPLNDLSLQEAHPATCFPSACATACSWNPDLLKRMGQALALECVHYDIQVLLGPGVNLKRHPAGGTKNVCFVSPHI